MNYPFTALVGQDQLKTALLLNAIDPGIGGVLIRGEKGTAKSTAARALAEMLPLLRRVPGCPFNCDPRTPWPGCPHCCALAERPSEETSAPFVDLPLGATEDRVLGTLDFEQALREKRRSFQPGLLATAHRGVLYIDEVNLLADHLVDVLLDAAALGVNTVQREGVAVTHPARFVLIGTMNPEEGELRPQLLDRFGLMVRVAGPREPGPRTEVVRRRLAFEADPQAFASRWTEEQAILRQRIADARGRLVAVVMEDGLLTFISQLCCEMEVDGLRADIVLHKTARGLAAFHGRDRVTMEDIRAAAELVLPHRQRRRPFQQAEMDPQQLDDLFSKLQPPPKPAADRPAPDPKDSPTSSSEEQAEGEGDERETEEGSRVFQPTPPTKVRRIEVSLSDSAQRSGHGRRNPSPLSRQGQFVRAVPDEKPTDLAVGATVRAAARRAAVSDGPFEVERCDLHRKERAGRTGSLILFVVDASGSMAARRRMEAVKGAVLGLLHSAYEQRDQVGVIAFRGPAAEQLLPPTDSVELAEKTLRFLPTGGRTPLAHALVLAHDVIRRIRRTQSDLPILLVLLSDGKANVGLPDAPGDPWEQACRAASELADARTSALVLDTEAGFIRAGRAQSLADALSAECLALEDLSSETLVLKIRHRVNREHG